MDEVVTPSAGQVKAGRSCSPKLALAGPRGALADRMRVVVPLRGADGMTAEELLRVRQANYDTALDARYAVANGRLWSTNIEPFSPLERKQFLSPLGPRVNLALSYGTLSSGGTLSFGDGDPGQLHRALIEEVLGKGEDI